MKFKEKDPIVSMEQWFPGTKIDNVKEVDVKQCEAKYSVEWDDIRDAVIVPQKRESPIRYLDGSTIRGAVVKQSIYIDRIGKNSEYYVNSFGGTYSSGLAIVLSSDWVLTYKSGRREVLTDKEKEERFE